MNEGVIGLISALIISILPTLLFLMLWRGLMAMRDDELVEKTLGKNPEASFNPAKAMPFMNSNRQQKIAERLTEGSQTVCINCGTRNPQWANYCENCAAELPTTYS